MHAVGDGVDPVLGEHGLGDLPVTLRHPVDEAGEEHPEDGHVEGSILEAADRAQRVTQLGPEDRGHHWGIEAVVAGWYRRVGGKDTTVPNRLDVSGRCVGQGPAEPVGEEGHRHQGGMAFVEVVGDDLLMAELPQHGRSGEAEDGLLGEPFDWDSGVEPVGNGLVGGVVLGEEGVEEVDGDDGPAVTAHNTSPHPDDHVPVPDGHLDLGAERLQAVGGPPVDGVLDLAAGFVEPLPEEAVMVEKGDPDDRHSQVGGGPEEIPGQHAEASTEGGDLVAQGDLHGEVGDGPGAHPPESGASTAEPHPEMASRTTQSCSEVAPSDNSAPGDSRGQEEASSTGGSSWRLWVRVARTAPVRSNKQVESGGQAPAGAGTGLPLVSKAH